MRFGDSLHRCGSHGKCVAAANRCADNHSGRKEHEVLDHELSFNGQQERIASVERDLGEKCQDEECPNHLKGEQTEDQPQCDSEKQANSHNNFEDTEHGDDPSRIEPVDGARHEVGDRLERLAAREGMSLSAFAARELAQVAQRADNPALLAGLPDLSIDAGTVTADLDAGRSER